jgi:hypothetical protein
VKVDSPRASGTSGTKIRKIGDELEGGLYIENEVFSESRGLGFVKVDGGEELLVRGSEELSPHLCP